MDASKAVEQAWIEATIDHGNARTQWVWPRGHIYMISRDFSFVRER